MDPDLLSEVIDLRQAASILGVPHKTLVRWREIGYMPPPDGMIGQAHVWLRASLEDWFAEVGRPKRGRPVRAE